MSDQSECSLTPQELRQALLTEIKARRQAIAELSNEELETIVGGLSNDSKWKIGVGVGVGVPTLAAASVLARRASVIKAAEQSAQSVSSLSRRSSPRVSPRVSFSTPSSPGGRLSTIPESPPSLSRSFSAQS